MAYINIMKIASEKDSLQRDKKKVIIYICIQNKKSPF